MVKIANVFEIGWLTTNGSFEGRFLSKGTSLRNPTFDRLKKVIRKLLSLFKDGMKKYLLLLVLARKPARVD